jgi:Kef-type K+ transport system membrane component KefB
MTHPQFRRKLEAIGFGVFIPVFFVTSGVKYDLNALTSSASTIAKVPIFLAALLLSRGLPALLYRPLIPSRHVLIAAVMQGTSLPFIVAGTAIGQQLGLISAGASAALIAAGLLSVLIFPALSLALLRKEPGMRVAIDRSMAERKRGHIPGLDPYSVNGGSVGETATPVM